jgi:hypothetical protein
LICLYIHLKNNYKSLKLVLFFTLLLNLSTNSRAQNNTLPVKADSIKHVKHKNSFLVAPIISKTPETNWAFAVASAYIFKTDRKDSALRTSTLPFGVTYTLNNQILAACAGNIFLPKEKYIVRWESSFSNFPDKFWGIGNYNLDNSDYESYSFTQLYLSPQFHIKVKGTKASFIGFSWDYQQVFKVQYGKEYNPSADKFDPTSSKYTDGQSFFDKDQVMGRQVYKISGPGFYYSFDNRNHAYVPDKGALLRIRFNIYSKYSGSDYNFRLLEIDYRKFVKTFGKQTLGIQMYTWNTFGDVPFRSLFALGGYNLMRGYYTGRFRDRMFLGGQVEYRMPIWWRFGAVAFAGLGQVAHNITDYKLEGFKYSIGSGLRFCILPKEKLNLRFDAAWGNYNTFNYYVILAESF